MLRAVLLALLGGAGRGRLRGSTPGCFPRLEAQSFVQLDRRGDASLMDASRADGARLVRAGRSASAASCEAECGGGHDCAAYTWLNASAAQPLNGGAGGACYGVSVPPNVSLSAAPMAGAVSGARAPCPPPAPGDDFGPDSSFYISGGEGAGGGMAAIFFGVMRAVGQTFVLVLGGLWLGRAGVVNKDGAKALSAIGMNLLIPSLLFVRVLDAATLELLRSAWLAAALPFFYVPCGALLGALCVLLTNPGPDFERGMIAAVTFGNSTGLPIIILSVVNDALMSREVRALTERDAADVPPTDPLVYLSLYSLTYPILQWSVGNALLSGSGRPLFFTRAPEPAPPACAAPPSAAQGGGAVGAVSPAPSSAAYGTPMRAPPPTPSSGGWAAYAARARREEGEEEAEAMRTPLAADEPEGGGGRGRGGRGGGGGAAPPAAAADEQEGGGASAAASGGAPLLRARSVQGHGGFAQAATPPRAPRGGREGGAREGGARPALSRALSVPIDGLDGLPVRAGGGPAGHQLLLRVGTHVRRAQLAGANNLNAVADGEAGGRVAPPMRETDVRVLDPATGLPSLEHVSFYLTARTRSARARRRTIGGEGGGGADDARAGSLGRAPPLALLPSRERWPNAWQRLRAQGPSRQSGSGSGSESGEGGSSSEAEAASPRSSARRAPPQPGGGAAGGAALAHDDGCSDSASPSTVQSIPSPPLPPGVPGRADPPKGPHAGGKEHPHRRGGRRWARAALSFVRHKLLVPPVRATLLGLALGLVPWTRALLLAPDGQAEPAPLAWLRAGIAKLGDAAVPTNLITLGASLAAGPDFSAISVRACGAIVVAKLVVMPAIAMAAVAAVDSTTSVAIIRPFQQPFYLTMFVVAATPTANNVLIMCTLAGQDRTAMSTAIFVQYACSPLILTATICGFVKIMVDML